MGVAALQLNEVGVAFLGTGHAEQLINDVVGQSFGHIVQSLGEGVAHGGGMAGGGGVVGSGGHVTGGGGVTSRGSVAGEGGHVAGGGCGAPVVS